MSAYSCSRHAQEEDAVRSPLLKIWELRKVDKKTGAPNLLRSAKVQPSNRPHPVLEVFPHNYLMNSYPVGHHCSSLGHSVPPRHWSRGWNRPSLSSPRPVYILWFQLPNCYPEIPHRSRITHRAYHRSRFQGAYRRSAKPASLCRDDKQGPLVPGIWQREWRVTHGCGRCRMCAGMRDYGLACKGYCRRER